MFMADPLQTITGSFIVVINSYPTVKNTLHNEFKVGNEFKKNPELTSC